MAGHSKWANIRHRKAAQDSVRSKIFAKFAKEIFVAAKMGGADLESNPALRLAVSKAKSRSMPSKNIKKAIDKATGSGDDSLQYKEYIFEGYAPGGVSIIVECLSENVNRVTSNVRSIFNKGGGTLGKNGSVSYLFDRLGIIEFDSESLDEEEVMMIAIEAGADDFEASESSFLITTKPNEFQKVKDELDQIEHINFTESEIKMVPNQLVKLSSDKAEKFLTLIDKFEDDDDVQVVYHNLDPASL